MHLPSEGNGTMTRMLMITLGLELLVHQCIEVSLLLSIPHCTGQKPTTEKCSVPLFSFTGVPVWMDIGGGLFRFYIPTTVSLS